MFSQKEIISDYDCQRCSCFKALGPGALWKTSRIHVNRIATKYRLRSCKVSPTNNGIRRISA